MWGFLIQSTVKISELSLDIVRNPKLKGDGRTGR